MLSPMLGSPVQEILTYQSMSSERSMKITKSLEHLTYDERLKAVTHQPREMKAQEGFCQCV